MNNKQSIMVDEIYPSRFLRGADLPGEGWLLTISNAWTEELEDFQGKARLKIVLSFSETEKEAAINKTQGQSLQDF